MGKIEMELSQSPEQALAYGYEVDPDSPIFIRRLQKIFNLETGVNLYKGPFSYANGKIESSTSSAEAGQSIAASFAVSGSYQAFSPSVSMSAS